MASRPLRVVVVGGGIGGLAAAHRVVEAAHAVPVQVTLVEAASRLGGTIRTERHDGFLLEAGPDSVISEKPWALALAERLGLGHRLCGTDEGHRRTYVVRTGRLHELPEGFLLLAPTRAWPVLRSGLLSWPGKLRMALDLVLPRAAEVGDESLASFVRRRLGREVLERIAAPLVAGIYTADPERLSLAATMPRFLALEREHRSLILGLRRARTAREAQGASGARFSLFVTLRGGMQELVDALAARLPPTSVRLGCAAVGLGRSPAGAAFQLRLADGTALAADGVVLAGQAHRMADLARDLDAELARRLQEISYASSVTVGLGYRRAAIRHPLDAFGFIVPRGQGLRLLACTFSSVKYPERAPAGCVLLRGFLGGAQERQDLLDEDDQTLTRMATDELGGLLGIEEPPLLTRVWRHPASMPQYELGHLDRVAAIEARVAAVPGLALAGAAYRGVGVSDAVRSGEAAADHLLRTLAGG